VRVRTIIAIVIGGMLGAAWGEGGGVLLGGAVAWLLLRSWSQQREIAELRQAMAKRVADPARQSAERSDAATAATPRPEAKHDTAAPGHEAGVPAAARVRDAASEAVGTLPATTAMPMDAVASTAEVSPEPPSRPPAPSAPAAPRSDWLAPIRQWFFGGNTIVKAGVGILFIGLAFLAKYASERVQVPIEWRLASVGGAALVLLGLGWWLRLKRPGYAQVLQGGAVAVLYLTLFVAFRFYGVLSVGPVFGLMVLVATLAAALAVLQNAMALAVIGALGGFATPLLVSTGSGNHVALFSYYLVLDLGIAAVAWFRTWRLLVLVGFVFTFLVGGAWGVFEYRDVHYATSQAFLAAFFLLFVAILLMPARRATDAAATSPGAHRWVNGSLLFGLPTVVFALQYGLVRHLEFGAALSALVLAAFYVALAAWMRSRPRLAVVFEGSLAVGVVLLTLVIPFALDARSTAGAWALEGAGLVWLGFRQSRRLARAFGYLLVLLAGGSLIYAGERFGAPTGVFNAMLFNGVMLVAGALAAAYFVHRHAAPATDAAQVGERTAEPLLIGWAMLWSTVTAMQQIEALVAPNDRLAALLAAASAVALLCVALSRRLAWDHVAWPVLALAPGLALGVVVSAVAHDSPAAHGGWWAWPLALGAHLVALRFIADRWPAAGQHAAHALGVLVLAALGALQGRAVSGDWGDGGSAWPWLGWLVVPAALLALLAQPRVGRAWPVVALPTAYRASAGAVLAAAALLWTLLANLISNGSARPLPHVPLLNPLDLGVAAALLATWLWLRSAPARERFAARPALAPALIGAAGFVWLNAMLVRAFHHLGGVPFRFAAWTESLAVQTGITLLWSATALALMWWSARRAVRAPWVVGAVLLAAVVAKLLLVDLSGTGTVMRIVSFIGVGVLMLVIGYVAPLPGKAAKDAKEGGHALA
jgi:uncharacterized membrane protein